MDKKKIILLVAGLLAGIVLLTVLANLWDRSQTAYNTPDGDTTAVSLTDALSEEDAEQPYRVLTLYLTVRSDKTSKKTNHTWSEVSSHSADFYRELGISRYKIDGILQEGDESGPQYGYFGYGATSPNAEVEVKGNASSRGAQKSYKLKLKGTSGKWHGQEIVNLSKCPSDGLRFRTKLCFDLLRDLPQMIAMRSSFVHLYVKDDSEGGSGKFEDYGLYTQTEQINPDALLAHRLDSNGYLYEMNDFDFYPHDAIRSPADPQYDKDQFERFLESKGNNDHTKLASMIAALNDPSLPTEQLLDDYFDRENLACWIALMILTGDSENCNNNAYLYSPLTGNRWYLIPCSFDNVLMKTETALISPEDPKPQRENSFLPFRNALIKRALSSERFRKELDTTIEELYRDFLSSQPLNKRLRKYSKATLSALYRMPDLEFAPLSQSQYSILLGRLSAEVAENRRNYQTSLSEPFPFSVLPPEQTGKLLTFRWEESKAADDPPITYEVTLSRDYTFKKPLEKPVKTDKTFYDYPKVLKPGQYFLRVKAMDKKGHSIGCQNCYYSSEGALGAVYCFDITENGGIQLYDAD